MEKVTNQKLVDQLKQSHDHLPAFFSLSILGERAAASINNC